MKRRAFLIATAALPLACSVKPKAVAPHPYGYFNPGEARVMDAWLQCLLPGSPGARECNALAYLDKQLQLPHFANVARAVRRTIARLQEAAKPSMFADLAAAEQNDLLTRLQSGQLTDAKINTQKTFELVHGFALEAFMSSPKTFAWLGNSPACPH